MAAAAVLFLVAIAGPTAVASKLDAIFELPPQPPASYVDNNIRLKTG